MSAKAKSAPSETPTKGSLATSRVSKPSRGAVKSNADSANPLQSSRLSVDRSPRTAPLKPTVERRSPKLSTPPDKKTTRILKPSELQAELNQAKEDLKRAKEKLGLVENEKEKVLDELKEAQRLAEEANGMLGEALVAQKRAEESSKIEQFRAVEIEQAGIEAAQKKDDEWEKELETVRNQHATDAASLLSATQEIHKVKQELGVISDAKNLALQHANDATKIAEAHSEKVEALSAELAHLKSVLDSRVETVANENNKFVSELKLEIDSLRQELEKAKNLEEKLAEKEVALEQLNIELEAAKMAELYACNLVDEANERVEQLASQAEQAKRLERSASESLESVIKQLEGSNGSLHDSRSEITALKEKANLLEISIERQKRDLDESDILLELAKEEASEMAKKVESLRSELETVKDDKIWSLNNEKLAAKSVQALLEEKSELINELGTSRDEEEKNKKALESLASALHEVSSEARDAKEKLLSMQVERENYAAQIEDLNLVLKATKEKYESMLDDYKHEINVLINSIRQSNRDSENLRTEWELKELHLTNSIKKSEEENSSMENEINRLVNLLKLAEEESCTTREEAYRWQRSFKEAESDAIYLKEFLDEAKDESMELKEGLMERETQLQNILQENDELRKKEAVLMGKIEELSRLLEEALTKKQEEENGQIINSEKDYDMLLKVVEFSKQNGMGEVELHSQETELRMPVSVKVPEVNDVSVDESVRIYFEKENLKENEKEKNNDDAKEVDLKMWENCKIEERDFSPKGETEQDSFENELDSKTDGVYSFDQANELSLTENLDNSGTSPLKELIQKKKSPLLRKFGNLLKKKSMTSQK